MKLTLRATLVALAACPVLLVSDAAMRGSLGMSLVFGGGLTLLLGAVTDVAWTLGNGSAEA